MFPELFQAHLAAAAGAPGEKIVNTTMVFVFVRRRLRADTRPHDDDDDLIARKYGRSSG